MPEQFKDGMLPGTYPEGHADFPFPNFNDCGIGCQGPFGPELPGPLLGTAEDCVVDDRGYIYMDTLHDGVYILRLKPNQK